MPASPHIITALDALIEQRDHLDVQINHLRALISRLDGTPKSKRRPQSWSLTCRVEEFLMAQEGPVTTDQICEHLASCHDKPFKRTSIDSICSVLLREGKVRRVAPKTFERIVLPEDPTAARDLIEVDGNVVGVLGSANDPTLDAYAGEVDERDERLNGVDR